MNLFLQKHCISFEHPLNISWISQKNLTLISACFGLIKKKWLSCDQIICKIINRKTYLKSLKRNTELLGSEKKKQVLTPCHYSITPSMELLFIRTIVPWLYYDANFSFLSVKIRKPFLATLKTCTLCSLNSIGENFGKPLWKNYNVILNGAWNYFLLKFWLIFQTQAFIQHLYCHICSYKWPKIQNKFKQFLQF